MVPSFKEQPCNNIDSKFEVVNEYQTLTTTCVTCYSSCCLAEVLFDYCEDCNKMASVPQGAFAACKIREQMKPRFTVAKISAVEKQPSDFRIFPNRRLTDLSPLKYNSKLMNAIWSHYNRYSPHNIKSNETNNISYNAESAQQLYRTPF